MKIIPQSCEVVWVTPDATRVIERAARTAYKSFDKIGPDSDEKIIKHLMHLKHESCLEHASACFKFVTDRGITHELVRHRLASYTQESTRYVKYGDLHVVKPLDMSEDLIWESAMLNAEISYKQMIDAGYKPQVARDVLPTCTAAEIVMTANFREWLHVFSLRTAKDAHPKIRQLTGMAYDILATMYPILFNAENIKRTCDWIAEAKRVVQA